MATNKIKSGAILTCAIIGWMTAPLFYVSAETYSTHEAIVIESSRAQEAAKYDPQKVTIITSKQIEEKQAKSIEDVIFDETGVSRTVDAMGRVGVSIRGAEARHTLILVDGQPVLGDFDRFSGAADEVMRIGTENVERIEIIQGAASAKYGANAIGGVVNIITKKAGKKAEIQFNAEGLRRKSDGDLLPYQNLFLRADSGSLGKLRLGLSGSKRDIIPVLASEERRVTDPTKTGDYYKRTFEPNVLRVHGEAADIGLVGSYEANKNNSFDFRINHYTEDLSRQTKRTDNDLEPQQNFKRKADRDTASLSWSGKRGKSDWKVETKYSRIKEDDIALMSYAGRSKFEGSNELRYIDNIDHKQYSVEVSANTAVNDRHFLSYGIGYSKETGEGSRLKGSPNTSTIYIDPWDYDKSLLVDKIDRMNRRPGDNSLKVFSHIHDYKFKNNVAGMPVWDMDFEYYGYDETDPSTQNTQFTYDDYLKYGMDADNATKIYRKYDGTITAPNGLPVSEEKFAQLQDFENKLLAENPGLNAAIKNNIVKKYFDAGDPTNRGKVSDADAPRFNGKKFLEEYQNRNQRMTVGKGEIKKQYAFVADNWQLNDRTILVPILRYDHSSLFGSHVSGTLGLTHNLKGNLHRRLKVNVGTGYNEPGMGELWYNWEMYSSTQINMSQARLGWYWVGNPDLKPEKSINFDLSIEGENKNTTMRAGIFHNRIRDYMSVYFTGTYIDFAPYLHNEHKISRAPDMIYSFKNIGKAEITGLEFEVRQKFGKNWSGRLGYTYLHAVNKSDPLMPRQLLDKPVHKIDVGISYENKKSGWGGQIWGNYYIDMLDPNAPADNRNLYPDILEGDAAVFKKQSYEKKTFGIWNLMIQKKLSKDSLIYFGINNLFNHRDDDRATQERVYRFGVNMKFGSGSEEKKGRQNLGGPSSVENKENVPVAETEKSDLNHFLDRPFAEGKESGVEVFGDYRARWNSHNGTNRPQSPYRANTYIGSAQKNMFDSKGHGMEQRVRIGVEARLGERTNLKFVGSASGMPGVDTQWSYATSKGISKKRVEELEVTQNVKKWDFSIGRLTEPMGVTGYWFGKEFDGVRAVWTGKDAQVRVGYGDFSHSTGISDSAYTHSAFGIIQRPPTVEELMGINWNDFPYDIYSATKTGSSGRKKNSWSSADADSPNGIYESTYKGKEDTIYFYQQLADSISQNKPVSDQVEIVKRLQTIVSGAYGEDLSKRSVLLTIPVKPVYKVVNDQGQERLLIPELMEAPVNDKTNPLYITATNNEGLVTDSSYISAHRADLESAIKATADMTATNHWTEISKGDFPDTYVLSADGATYTRVSAYDPNTWQTTPTTGYKLVGVVGYAVDENWVKKPMTGDMLDALYKANYTPIERGDQKYRLKISPVVAAYLRAIQETLQETEFRNKLPREALGNIIGNVIQAEGITLEQDRIPPIDRAAFVQAKKKIGSRLGIQAWYLRSMGTDVHAVSVAKDEGNQSENFDKIANVFGVGAVYQIGKHTKLSFDYGQNRSSFGRFMNGNTIYEHERGTADFTVKGREFGSVPSFWTVRFDIGMADVTQPGSWNAYIDYKHFEHGSFFGGNGTGAVPDRYLDGVRSFTVGTGYVPVKNLLLEAFYTFDAKGTGSRDTLFGPEKFRLGNYTRVQATYRF